jgi:hypothetical protein
LPEKNSTSNSSERDDKYKDVLGFLYSIEEKLDKEFIHISRKLKETLERMIEKKLEYYL